MKTLKTWCWRPVDEWFKNFGDELGPIILQKLGYKVKRVPLHEAEILTCGTILDQAKAEARDGTILWGCGASWDRTITKQFDIRALRGQLTAKTLEADVTLGDPGILVSLFWQKQITKYKIGVVPHYVDERNYSWADIVIDVRNEPEQVIKQISSCEIICSSSLHGLIVAHSYGIPAMRIAHTDIIGGDFKWMDYISAMDRPVKQVQDDLIKALG